MHPFFDQFWDAYPRKTAKQTANKAFDKLPVDQTLLDTMLLALGNQQNDSQWQDKRYIPYPATWLNNRRWEDSEELEAPNTAQCAPITQEAIDQAYQSTSSLVQSITRLPYWVPCWTRAQAKRTGH